MASSTLGRLELAPVSVGRMMRKYGGSALYQDITTVEHKFTESGIAFRIG